MGGEAAAHVSHRMGGRTRRCTSAQATLGGVEGNNSCGSSSIAYGNMVHNAVGAEALLADGTEGCLGPESAMQGAAPRAWRSSEYSRLTHTSSRQARDRSSRHR